jgi:DNA/RNA endonuclease YhcR with UshA esterase domain
MNSATVIAVSAALGLWAQAVSAAEVGIGDASKHIGETATVCDVVASAKFLSASRRQPTFLNLGEPYPDQIFTVVIFGSDRAKFGTPETSLKDKHICVTGKIQEYRGVPEIIVNDPKQLGQ